MQTYSRELVGPEGMLPAPDGAPTAQTGWEIYPDALGHTVRLGEITAPTLVMIGRLDAEDIQVINEPLAKIIPNARLVWLDDVAHLPHLEGDRKTLDEIVSFVDHNLEMNGRPGWCSQGTRGLE